MHDENRQIWAFIRKEVVLLENCALLGKNIQAIFELIAAQNTSEGTYLVIEKNFTITLKKMFPK